MCLATNFTQYEVSKRKDVTGIYSSSFPFVDFITWPQSHIDGCLITSHILMSSLITMKSIIKEGWWNAYSDILIIAPDLIRLQLCSKFFGQSYTSASSPLLSATSHFQRAFEQSTILIMHLDIPQMMKGMHARGFISPSR